MKLVVEAIVMNITKRCFVAIGKIWYYNKTLCYNRKDMILQQDALLQ